MNTVILMNDYLFIQLFYDVMFCINIQNDEKHCHSVTHQYGISDVTNASNQC